VEGWESLTMPIFKASVQDGRLVLDEPTDLPEGEVVYLQTLDASALVEGGMTKDEREDLFQALDEAIESVRPPEETEDEPDDAMGETAGETESSPTTAPS
jgi:hypothetical protein